MRTCIICGVQMPEETCYCGDKHFPRILCRTCASEGTRDEDSAHRVLRIPDAAIEGCAELAGAIVRPQVAAYGRAYQDALTGLVEAGVRHEDVRGFLRLHKAMMSPYWDALTMGNITGVLHDARCAVRRQLRGKSAANAARRLEDMLAGEEVAP